MYKLLIRESKYIDPDSKYSDFGTGKVVDDNIFDDRTHVPFYDQLFTNPEYMAQRENLKGHVEMMSPKEYFEECASKIFSNTSVESLIKSRSADPTVLNEITEIISKYKRQVFLPYINYAEQNQEGLHRMLVAARLFGWNHKFPVLVITYADEERAIEQKKQKEVDRIRRYIKDATIDTLKYNFNSLSEFEDELKAQIEYKFDFIDEEIKSFNISYADDIVEIETNNVIYQIYIDDIKIKTPDETDVDLDEIEDIEFSEEELYDINNLSIDDFLKKYG